MHGIELEKAYNPQDFEDRIYKEWKEKGYFKPCSDKDSPVHESGDGSVHGDCCSQKKCTEKHATNTVEIPPPNVTRLLPCGFPEQTMRELPLKT